METSSLSPTRRLDGYRAYSRAADARESVAWKAPTAHRFHNHVANDASYDAPAFRDVMQAMPGWAVIVGGGVVAALTGAMLGGMLHI